MPKLKESLGKVEFNSPFMPELQRYLMYELENARQRNPETDIGGMTGVNKWRYEFRSPKDSIYNWVVLYDSKLIIATSKQPKIYIRKGLSINMGSARIEIE